MESGPRRTVGKTPPPCSDRLHRARRQLPNGDILWIMSGATVGHWAHAGSRGPAQTPIVSPAPTPSAAPTPILQRAPTPVVQPGANPERAAPTPSATIPVSRPGADWVSSIRYDWRFIRKNFHARRGEKRRSFAGAGRNPRRAWSARAAARRKSPKEC
jgi:hypothetical protein